MRRNAAPFTGQRLDRSIVKLGVPARAFDFGDECVRERPDAIFEIRPLLSGGADVDIASPFEHRSMFGSESLQRPLRGHLLRVNLLR